MRPKDLEADFCSVVIAGIMYKFKEIQTIPPAKQLVDIVPWLFRQGSLPGSFSVRPANAELSHKGFVLF